jgi:signal transduction histidine kinase
MKIKTKSLYVRIVLTFAFIGLISSIAGLLCSSMYYQSKLLTGNERKAVQIGNEIKTLLEKTPSLAMDSYLAHIANLGYQIYVVNDRKEGAFYGSSFRRGGLDPADEERVLNGELYYGTASGWGWLSVSNLFEDSLRNTVGVPMTVNGERYALFIRPDLQQQLGDIRIIMAVLLGSTFVFSLCLIVIFTTYIVKPIKKLTEATRRLVGGRFDVEVPLDVARQDELGNLARHFTEMALSLRQLDEMRQQFVANVSHEIQSPLTSIQGFVQAVLDEGSTSEEKERYLHIIDEESRRLSALSKQLLTLAALDNQSRTPDVTTYRLDEQLRQIIILLEWEWTSKGLELTLDLPETTITADEGLLYQVWLNLIVNSMKFTSKEGSIRIAIQSEQPEAVVVTVSDTGIGIEADQVQHLFERFYKADRSRDRSRSGSGLGLSIAKDIVTLHGGTITAESELGVGTIITVKIPKHQQQNVL